MTVPARDPRGDRFQAHGAVLVLDSALAVLHASSSCDAVLGIAVEDLVGQPLTTILSAEDGPPLAQLLAAGAAGLGWQRARVSGVRPVKVRGFEPAPGLIGLDLVPQHPSAQISGAQAVERVAQWSEQLLVTTEVAQLFGLAATTVNALTGFEGTWACRLEPEGHSLVVAADASSVGDTVGQWVDPLDVPPAQPVINGRPIPFFVADLAAEPVHLVPAPAPELDFQTSALRRPYDAYLDRLLEIGVQATLSVPIVVDGRLYARLIAHDPSPHEVPPAAQAELRLLGAATSTHLSELLKLHETRERLDRTTWSSRILESIAEGGDLFDGLLADPQALLGLCSAASVLVSIDGRDGLAGEAIEPTRRNEILRLARAALDHDAARPLAASDTMSDLWPESTDAVAGGGILAIRLSGDASNVVVWVRPQTHGSVTWVTHRAIDDDSGESLFADMSQRVEPDRASSTPWNGAQIQAVADFHAALATLVMARYQQVAQLNAQLARSNAEFDAFAHAAAHDLKQPLRSIRQYTEFFLEDVEAKLTSAEREQVDTVLRLTGRMNGLLDDLMRYAEIGETAWRPRSIDLREAAGQAIELLPPALVDGVDLQFHGEVIHADPASLQQLLLNLITNAVKYSDGHPEITIGVTSLGAAAEAATPPDTLVDVPPETPALFVRDRGIGIEPSYHRTIFELFKKIRGDSAGSGAGLAICRRIARRHGGDIWVSSEPGEGSTFYVVVTT